jgi:hypothetical protein
LEKIESIVTDKINDTAFLGEASRPDATGKLLERLGLTHADKRIVHDCFNSPATNRISQLPTWIKINA